MAPITQTLFCNKGEMAMEMLNEKVYCAIICKTTDKGRFYYPDLETVSMSLTTSEAMAVKKQEKDPSYNIARIRMFNMKEIKPI